MKHFISKCHTLPEYNGSFEFVLGKYYHIYVGLNYRGEPREYYYNDFELSSEELNLMIEDKLFIKNKRVIYMLASHFHEFMYDEDQMKQVIRDDKLEILI